MYEVELFHQFSSRILQNVCPDRQTDNVDQDQTAHTVQSDVGFIISVNLWDTFLSKKKIIIIIIRIIIITLKWHYQGFNHVL